MKLNNEKKQKDSPYKFFGKFGQKGNMEFVDRESLVYFMSENAGMRFELKPLYPESAKQRKWFEGAFVPLVAFYQEGMDHRDSEDLKRVRQWLKIEFNGELVAIGGRTHKLAQSTKNRLNLGFLDRCTEWLIENYAPPVEAMDPKAWKHWHDAIFPNGGPDDYIDYLLERKILKK